MTKSQIVYIDLKLKKTRKQYAPSKARKRESPKSLCSQGRRPSQRQRPCPSGTSEEGAALPLSLPTYIQISTKASIYSEKSKEKMDYATWPLQIKEKSYASDTNRTHLEKRNHQLLIQLNQRKRSEKAEISQCEKAKKVTRRPEEGERRKGVASNSKGCCAT